VLQRLQHVDLSTFSAGLQLCWVGSSKLCWHVIVCFLAVKSTNSIQQPSLSRPTQQVVGQPSSQSMAASGDAVQNRIDDITAQVGSTPAALCCADLSVKLPFLGLV